MSDITRKANWETDNQDVAIAYDGRILALGEGNTFVTVSYNGMKQIIQVKVLNQKVFETNISIAATSERDLIKSKCSAMVNYKWKPTKDLVGWRGKFTFYANTVYHGIPYSQTAYQKDDIGFGEALSFGDFYDYYTRNLNNEIIRMPKYGNDCSGFTSFAWGISRQTTYTFLNGIKNGTYKKVGTYDVDNPTTDDLKNSYTLLQTGDAVVSEDHVFVIDQNNPTFSPKSVYCYEQTPYIATWTIWTYDQLANGKYRPFSRGY